MAATRALEDKEIFAIFDSIKGRHAIRNRAMLLVGIAGALRATELVSLTVGDVYNKKEVKTYVTIRGETAKFGKQRTIRLGEGVRHAIREFIEFKREHGESIDAFKPLFRSQKGGHLTRIALLQTVTRIFGKARIDQSPHALRKTGATIYYIASDYDLLATQQFLGHASPSTTRKYIGLTTEQLVNYSEKASRNLFNAMHTEGGEGKFITKLHMINYTEQDKQHLLSQLETKDDQITFLNHQLSRLTQLLWERTTSGSETFLAAVAATDAKVIPIDSLRKPKTSR